MSQYACNFRRYNEMNSLVECAAFIETNDERTVRMARITLMHMFLDRVLYQIMPANVQRRESNTKTRPIMHVFMIYDASIILHIDVHSTNAYILFIK